MPTVLDVLRTHLLGDEAADKLEEVLARWNAMTAAAPTRRNLVKPNLACSDVAPANQLVGLLESFAAVIVGSCLMVGKVIQSLAPLPPSRGYEPLLVEAGWNQFSARGVAKIAVRHGRRCAEESNWHRPVIDAIRFLAKPQRQRRAILRRAKLILQACKETSIIETIFFEAGLIELEFVRLLESVVEGREVDCRRITEIAAVLAPRLSLPRGPKVSAPSAAHEFLLDPEIGITLRRPPATYRKRKAEYIDALTAATRLEFNAPHFDPRPARRRIARQKANSGAK
jgi:hypothetical protein